MYFYIEPEVNGGLGCNTVFDTSLNPPRVLKLHCQFDGWQGDDLIEYSPCFIISQFLATEIQLEQLTGFQLDAVEISKSEQFMAICPEKELPNLYWLKVVGRAGKDDFGLAWNSRLVVSYKALKAMKTKGKLDAAKLEQY